MSSTNACLEFIDKNCGRRVQRLHDDESSLQPMLAHDLVQIPRDIDQPPGVRAVL